MGRNRFPGEEYSFGFLYGTMEARRQEASVSEGPALRASRRRGTLAAGRTEGTVNKNRCMVCAKEGMFEGGICDLCKAIIRGEALEGQHQLRKEADKSLHKEGLEIEKKTHG